MPRAVIRAACALLLSVVSLSARSLTATRVSGADYISMVDACGRLGLRFSFSGNGRSMNLRGGGHTAVLLPPGDGSHRLMILDGVRVHLGDLVVDRAGSLYVSRIDYERRLLPLFRPDLVPNPPHRPRIIMLDPGHGGNDPGAQNPRYRLQEKVLTLDVAERLRPLLLAQGWTVLMTRTRDTQISIDKAFDLEERARLAGAMHADLLLSIHFDAGSPQTHGSMILAYNPAGQRSTENWGMGQRNNAQAAMPGNRFDPWNFVLEHALFRDLPRLLQTNDLGERIQNISIARNAQVPTVLVEPAYISNDGEARRLMTPAFRQQVAEGLAAGLKRYAETIDALQPAPVKR
jgi:N-acetylmuramoyl-L-alanine amidase